MLLISVTIFSISVEASITKPRRALSAVLNDFLASAAKRLISFAVLRPANLVLISEALEPDKVISSTFLSQSYSVFSDLYSVSMYKPGHSQMLSDIASSYFKS